MRGREGLAGITRQLSTGDFLFFFCCLHPEAIISHSKGLFEKYSMLMCRALEN